MNKVVLIGRFTKDPDLRFAAGSGNAVTKFTLAVNRVKKEGQQEADFISCVAFGKTAETIAEHFIKGRQIAVEGNIRTGSYEAQDGSKRYTTDVFIERFDFVGEKQEMKPTTYGDEMVPVDDEGDSIPF